MKFTYYGHSCFAVQFGNNATVIAAFEITVWADNAGLKTHSMNVGGKKI